MAANQHNSWITMLNPMFQKNTEEVEAPAALIV